MAAALHKPAARQNEDMTGWRVVLTINGRKTDAELGDPKRPCAIGVLSSMLSRGQPRANASHSR